MTVPSRFRALMLLLLFLSSGTSLPGADVLLFHLNGKAPHAEAHVESADGCATHAGHCGLGVPASAGTALPTDGSTPIVRVNDVGGAPRALDQHPSAGGKRRGFNSRAPPVSHV